MNADRWDSSELMMRDSTKQNSLKSMREDLSISNEVKARYWISFLSNIIFLPWAIVSNEERVSWMHRNRDPPYSSWCWSTAPRSRPPMRTSIEVSKWTRKATNPTSGSYCSVESSLLKYKGLHTFNWIRLVRRLRTTHYAHYVYYNKSMY